MRWGSGIISSGFTYLALQKAMIILSEKQCSETIKNTEGTSALLIPQFKGNKNFKNKTQKRPDRIKNTCIKEIRLKQ